jgi:hypothetical protein
MIAGPRYRWQNDEWFAFARRLAPWERPTARQAPLSR